MAPVFVARTGIAGGTKVHDIRREQRRTLLETLKDFYIPLTGVRPVEEAVVTAGGVAVGQVDPKTMESKQASGLYFAGSCWMWTATPADLICKSRGQPAMPQGWPRPSGC